MSNPSFVGSSIAVNTTVSRTPANGNDLILQIIALGGSGVTLSSITDSAAGATVLTDFAFTYDSTHACGIGIYRVHAAPNTTNTFSASWSTAPTKYYMILNEASGVSGLDPIAGSLALALGNSANPTTDSLSPQFGDLLFAAFGVDHFVSSLSWTNGFNQTHDFIAGPMYGAAYLPNAPGGNIDAGISIGATAYNYAGLLVAYSGSNSGFLPLSHSMQTQSMIAIYPNSSAGPFIAAKYAYWDGTTGFYPPQRVGVAFGRWPYVYELISGPQGMAIGATAWNTAWNGNPAAAFAAGYGVVNWTPNASNTSGGPFTVTVRVYDQNYQNGAPPGSWVDITWTLTVVDNTSTQFCFINADSGSDSTGNGTISNPWQTIHNACGGYLNGTTAQLPAGAKGSILVLRGATNQYWLPISTLGGFQFTINPSAGPASIVGMPGESATIDLTATQQGSQTITGSISGNALTTTASASLQVGQSLYGATTNLNSISGFYITGGSGTSWALNKSGSLPQTTILAASCASNFGLSGSDVFVGNVTLNDYPAQASDFRAFLYASTNRVTFQGITWNNAGYGLYSDNNASMFYTTGGSLSYGSYLFITGIQENNRQSNSQANNCAVCELYSYQNSLVELNLAKSPSSLVGECFYMKSDLGNTCMRANVGIFAGCNHGFDWGQAPYQGSNNSESCYNIGVNVGNILVPGIPGYTFGNLSFFRNSTVSGLVGFGCASPNFNLIGPVTHANLQPFGYNVAAPSTNTSGGSLGSGTWIYGVTTVGGTGESTFDTSNGANAQNVTTTGTTNAVTVPFYQVPLASSYNGYRAPVISPPSALAGSLASGGTLTLNHTYTWVVTALGTFGETVVSNSVSLTPTVSGTQAADLTWTNPAGATANKVYRTPGTSGGATGYFSPGLTTSFTDTGANGTSGSPSTVNSAVGSSGFTVFSIAAGSAQFVDNGSGGTTGAFPPSSNTAISSASFAIKSNLMQNPTQSSVPTANTIAQDCLNSFSAVVGTMLDTTTGLMTTAFKNANPSYVGTRGAEIG